MITLDGITLPDGLVWVDRYDWTPVRQNINITLAGSLVIYESSVRSGRPITLQGDETSCWIKKSDLEALTALAQTPGRTMTLTINDTSYTVRFRRDVTPIEARQLFPIQADAETAETLYVLLAVRLLEVS